MDTVTRLTPAEREERGFTSDLTATNRAIAELHAQLKAGGDPVTLSREDAMQINAEISVLRAQAWNAHCERQRCASIMQAAAGRMLGGACK